MDIFDALFWLAVAGTLFSGYMTAHRLITKRCPFNEACPYFLGRPACDYGFGMFLILLTATALGQRGTIDLVTASSITFWVSLVGVIFSGSFLIKEFFDWLRSGRRYGLILPSCAYGSFVFIVIFLLVFSVR